MVMGAQAGSQKGDADRFSQTRDRVEARAGKIPLSARYHKAPHSIHDDYDLQSTVLGSGCNGAVRQASSKNPSNKEKYAVKAFKFGSCPQDKRQQLESEVEIFLTLDHPHITRLFDVYEEADMLFLVMECMEGGELFDRVQLIKRFSERDAADAVWQMLLALNYLHTHKIVHRDLKLENFLYDKKGSDHLKLIDFGFSKAWDPNIRMHVSCGTLSYVAPEVLKMNYTSQCDLWSLGVIAFILLVGYMPFSGSEAQQTTYISQGKYSWKPEKWKKVSQQGQSFITALLQVDPQKRLSAQDALEHPWIQKRQLKEELVEEVDASIVDALRQFGSASKFRRCCMEMMAWSLSNDERSRVRQDFLAMDKNKQGTITLFELKTVLEDKFNIPQEETKRIFDAMDSNHDEEIHYSDFLAAMVSTRIAMHDDLLKAAFKKFDVDASGYITVENLREVLGDIYDGVQVEQLLQEADILKDNRISYAEFVAYLRGDPLEAHGDAAAQLIDAQMGGVTRNTSAGWLKGVPSMRLKKSSSDNVAASAHDADAGKVGGASARPETQPKQCCSIQ